MMGILKKALCAVLITILIISAFSMPTSAKVTRKLRGEYAEGEVIVKLKSSAGSKFLKKKNAASLYGGGLSMESSSELGKKNKLKFVTLKSKSKTTAELVESLEDNENVEYAIPNYVKRQCSLSNDTYADFQWALKNNGNENGIESVDTAAPQLWEKSARYGKEQIVAVIDSGIDLTHEDLKDVLWTNPYGDELTYGYIRWQLYVNKITNDNIREGYIIDTLPQNNSFDPANVIVYSGDEGYQRNSSVERQDNGAQSLQGRRLLRLRRAARL